jgi:peptidyl-tRNA hydrolase, PTH1 family
MKNEEKKYSANNIKAIIGLGNPGQKYYKTRHNIGFRIIDELAQQNSVSFQHTSLLEHAEIILQDSFHKITLIKPLTFMNNSGQVISYTQKKGIKTDEIIVIHDELEKAFGKISLRIGGSARGHNGLRSIINIIGKDFWRLRFGIGRPEDKTLVGDYVLQQFSQNEEQKIPLLTQNSCDYIALKT